MELWTTQKLRDALTVLADDPAVREAARLSHLDHIISDASPQRGERQDKGGARGKAMHHRPFWAKLRTEIDEIITTTRDQAVALAAAAVAQRLGDGDAAHSRADADDWAELVGEWCSAMEFFAESARALVLAESGPRDERPIPTVARRCRRAVAVMERVGDAYDDLEAISNQGGGIPIGQLSEIFLPASAGEHAEGGWLSYYWRIYFDILAASCEMVGSGLDKGDLQGWLERAVLRDRETSTPRETGLLQAYEAALAAAKKQHVTSSRCMAFMAVHTAVESRRSAAEEALWVRRRAIEPQAAAMRRKFRAAAYGDMNDPTGKRGLTRLFGRVDGDHSGMIDYHELVSAAKRIGRYMISNEDLAVIFGEIDGNNDGLITVDEFSDWCQHETATKQPLVLAPPSLLDNCAAEPSLSPVIETGESAGEASYARAPGHDGAANVEPGGSGVVVSELSPRSTRQSASPRSVSSQSPAPLDLVHGRIAAHGSEHRRQRGMQGVKTKTKDVASPYGDISAVMARVDKLGKQGGVGIGFGANLLRAELIERRMTEKKKASKAKARIVRQQRRQVAARPGTHEESRAIDESWEAPTEVIASARHYRPPKSVMRPPWESSTVVGDARAAAVTSGRPHGDTTPSAQTHKVEDDIARDFVDELTAGLMRELSGPDSESAVSPSTCDTGGSAEPTHPRQRCQRQKQKQKQRAEIVDPYTGSSVSVAPHTRCKQQKGRGMQRYSAGLFADERATNARVREEMTVAATRIQAVHRGRSTRAQILELGEEDVDMNQTHARSDEVEQEAATTMQAVQRGRASRRRMQETKAATTMQAMQRGRVARRGRQARVMARDQRWAATRIQARIRGRTDRQSTRHRAAARNAARRQMQQHETNASTKIQAHMRGRAVRRATVARHAETSVAVTESKALAEAPVPAEDATASNLADYAVQLTAFTKLDDDGSGLLDEDELGETVQGYEDDQVKNIHEEVSSTEHVTLASSSAVATDQNQQTRATDVWKAKGKRKKTQIAGPHTLHQCRRGPSVATFTQQPVERLSRKCAAIGNVSSDVGSTGGTRQQIIREDHRAFERIASGGDKLSPMAQILANRIREGKRKAAEAANSAARSVAGNSGKGYRAAAASQGNGHPGRRARWGRGRRTGRPIVEGAGGGAKMAKQKEKRSVSRDPVMEVVREIVGGAVSGAVRTVLKDLQESSAIKVVLSAPDLSGIMQPVSGSGAKAARARRVSGSGVPLPPLMGAERQRAMAYGAVPTAASKRRGGVGSRRAPKQQPPAAVTLPPLVPIS
eukprot:COSAG02_NODE_751_length_17653_cov_172.765011_9_plen_1287_part_00